MIKYTDYIIQTAMLNSVALTHCVKQIAPRTKVESFILITDL